jgi:predicted nucleotidyltransferase
MTQALPALVLRYAQRVRQRLGARVEQLRVFGSYARGQAHEESDLDLLVVVRDLTRVEKLELIDMATEEALGQGIALHALIMSQAEHAQLHALEARLVRDIADEGVAV